VWLVHFENIPSLETVCNLKLCLLVQESSIWNLLIMCGARDVITGQLDVTPGTRGGGRVIVHWLLLITSDGVECIHSHIGMSTLGPECAPDRGENSCEARRDAKCSLVSSSAAMQQHCCLIRWRIKTLVKTAIFTVYRHQQCLKIIAWLVITYPHLVPRSWVISSCTSWSPESSGMYYRFINWMSTDV
jgi:hypothetical protein